MSEQNIGSKFYTQAGSFEQRLKRKEISTPFFYGGVTGCSLQKLRQEQQRWLVGADLPAALPSLDALQLGRGRAARSKIMPLTMGEQKRAKVERARLS
jgi:hypothetical protein